MQRLDPMCCSGVSAAFLLYALLFNTLRACDVGTCGAPPPSLPTLRRFPNCASLIERAFLLWCLGNNVLEHLPKGEEEMKTVLQQFIAKKCCGHQTSFPN